MRIRGKHVTLIECDCEANDCIEKYVSYSMISMVTKQAKELGWRYKRRSDGTKHWFAPGHRGAWERPEVDMRGAVAT